MALVSPLWEAQSPGCPHRGTSRIELHRSLCVWEEIAGQTVGGFGQARDAFLGNLVADTGFTAAQVATLSARTSPSSGADDRSRLVNLCEEYLVRLRRWYPVWTAFALWASDWCRARTYPSLAFLCRDGLPLFASAAAATNAIELKLLYLSRRTRAADGITKHLQLEVPEVYDNQCPVAFLDSGCYGSLLPVLLAPRNGRATGGQAATFFYFSRQPRVFGYVNYLIAGDLLSGALSPREAACATDFVIYAGDVLEAVPKFYDIVDLPADGRPRLRPRDPVSFAIGLGVMREISAYTARLLKAGRRPQPRRTLRRLLTTFALPPAQTSKARCLLIDEPVPKAVPQVPDGLDEQLRNLPPQTEFFGAVAG